MAERECSNSSCSKESCEGCASAKQKHSFAAEMNVYSDVKEITVNEVSVTLKGDEGQYKLAIWQQDGFAYSLSYEPGGSENVFVEMIQSVQ